MQEVTHPSVAQSNTVKQSNRYSRGNMECKYKLFLVNISVQMHNLLILMRCLLGFIGWFKKEPPVIDGPVVQAPSLSTNSPKDFLPPSRIHQKQSDHLRR